jgi:protein-L-isoaspartate(D-aspartate) O-methyltransferase
MAAIAAVPRHEFVPDEARVFAYDNRALAIGSGQTISQPYIVALMTDLLGLTADDIVLEVGTGCGYQTAILARLAKKVYTVEIVRPLGEQAAQRLTRMGINNVEAHIADGREGWPEGAPFDAIIVTAAAEAVPPKLIDQLKTGGRMVLPLGDAYKGQELVLINKDPQGAISQHSVLPVVFVPLTAGAPRD